MGDSYDADAEFAASNQEIWEHWSLLRDGAPYKGGSGMFLEGGVYYIGRDYSGVPSAGEFGNWGGVSNYGGGSGSFVQFLTALSEATNGVLILSGDAVRAGYGAWSQMGDGQSLAMDINNMQRSVAFSYLTSNFLASSDNSASGITEEYLGTIRGAFYIDQNGGMDDFYYNSINGMKLPNGLVLSRDNVLLSFNEDITPSGNAHYLGFKDGKHHVNFSIEDYEVTKANIRATTFHEIYGHGILRISGRYDQGHYKAYFLVMDHSSFWDSTTEQFKTHFVDAAYQSWFYTTGKEVMPSKYENLYQKHHKW